MLLKDHWYVASPSSQLTSDKPTPFQVGDIKYVAFRDAQGGPHILLDRCCHRGVQLSLGRMINGCVSCGYHGWEYNGAGQLIHIPGQGPDETIPSFSVPSFPVRENDFYIWIWIAGESESPTYEPGVRGLIPGTWAQQSNVWLTNVIPAVENNMDNAHTPFSHPGNYPGHRSEFGRVPNLRPIQFECFSTDSSVHVFGPPRQSLDEPIPCPESPGPGFGLFELPYKNYVFLKADGTRAIYHWIPLSEGSCRLEFMAYSTPRDSEMRTEIKVKFIEKEHLVLKQDRVLLESAQHWADTNYEHSIRQDVAPMMARKLIKAAAQGANLENFNEKNTRKIFECYL